MQHNPIQINKLAVYFSHKICFENFSTTVHYGDRIAIIGRNGSGKTTLLNILRGAFEPSEGSVNIPKNVLIGYVPQIVEDVHHLSGGQRFNAALTQALSNDPNILLLDEPTNHLDYKNRRSLMRMIQSYEGTVIVVSHDPELLRSCMNSYWHIENGHITIFNGSYDEYVQSQKKNKEKLLGHLASLEREKKQVHADLMREQERSKKSRLHGEKRYGGDTITLRAMQSRGQASNDKRKKNLDQTKQEVLTKLASLHEHEEIKPKFSITAADVGSKNVITVTNGSCGYKQHPILEDISLSISSGERVAIAGDNGSGKSTLLRAIMHDPAIITAGTWLIPKKENIGYLDQHYSSLDPEKTVFEQLQNYMPGRSHAEIRSYLNNFLFRKNEEIQTKTKYLSGGERARLSLALIGAKTPPLLLLDEITNNIDLETREHVIEVLRDYPGTVIVVSHDKDFLTAIGIERTYETSHGKLIQCM